MPLPKACMSNKQYNGAIYRNIAKRSRAANEGLPPSFILLSVPVGKTIKPFIFCNKKLSNGLSCDFCIRKDTWNGDANKLAHECKHINRIVFANKTPIPEGFKGLYKSINAFTAIANISFSQITSKSFNEVITSAIEVGQRNPGTNPSELYAQVSRKTFTKQWNKESDDLFGQQLQEYAKEAGSALAIDGGKHKSISYLLVIITNIFSSVQPLLVRSIQFFGGKTIDYKTAMTEVVTDLKKQGIKISGIVTDNLRTQTSAVNHHISTSFQNEPGAPPYIRDIIWISCACHSLALAINDVLKTVDEFSEAFNNLSLAVKFLRAKNVINLIEATCPPLNPTRWTGIFDVAYWIISHNSGITNKIFWMLRASKAYEIPSAAIIGMISSAKKLFLWLLPFKIASEKLEAEHLSAAYIHPVVNASLELSTIISEKYMPGDNVSGFLRGAVTKRMFRTSTGSILSFLYLSTPEGRYEFRIKYPEAIKGRDTITPSTDFSLNYNAKIAGLITIITAETFHNKEIQLLHEYREYSGTLLDPKYGTIVDHDIRDEDENLLQATSTIEQESDSSSDESTDDDSSDITSFDIEEPHEFYIDPSRGWLTTATNSMEELLKQQQKSETEKEELINFFITWVTGDPDETIPQQRFLNYGVSYWQKVFDDSNQAKFSHFVLPYLSIPSSESICERAFWFQKRILGDHSLRSGQNTEINRINYLLQRKK